MLTLDRRASRQAFNMGTTMLRFDLRVNRLASQKQVVRALRHDLKRFLPRRPIDGRIFDAVMMRKNQPNLSYQKISIRVFGTPDMERNIRHWFNRLFEDVR